MGGRSALRLAAYLAGASVSLRTASASARRTVLKCKGAQSTPVLLIGDRETHAPAILPAPRAPMPPPSDPFQGVWLPMSRLRLGATSPSTMRCFSRRLFLRLAMTADASAVFLQSASEQPRRPAQLSLLTGTPKLRPVPMFSPGLLI